MVVALIEGLGALGHRVSLLAPRGTRLPGATVIDVPAAVLLGREGDVRSHVPAGAEILHAHYVVARPPAGVAFVQTLHGNLAAGEAVPPNTVFLSWNHAVRHGATTFAYNGLNPAALTFRAQKDDYDLFIGRLHSVKGYRWDTLDELIEGSRTIETRSAEACRAHAERYFTHITMAEQYVSLYRNLLATGALGPGRPTPYTIT